MSTESPRWRRACFALLCLATAAGLLCLLWRVLAPGGWTGWEVAILVGFIGMLPWPMLAVGNGLIGFLILMGSRDPPAQVMPQLRWPVPPGPLPRTAIVVCIRDEAMEVVLPPLAALLDGLAAAGVADRFVLWLLSDSRDGAGEAAAIAGFAAARPAGQVRYRRRTDNAGFKAGNVMDFLDHHAEGLELMLCLDADSEMSAAAVLRLARCMAADPRLAIVQQLIAGRPAAAPFPRLFQFGMRAGMRAWATGQAWWQLDEGPYWGHNAMIRIAPFRAHARLEKLPDGSTILSHDQIEAVRLHAAGWKVRCLPIEEGSLEANPPALPEFLIRSRRWAAGNMQYWQLLRLPGLTPMGIWQLWQAMVLFATAPFVLLLPVGAIGNALSGGSAATPGGALAWLMLATWLCCYAPKLLGSLEVLLKPGAAARYGGRGRFLRGMLAEWLFTLFYEPVGQLNSAVLVLGLPFGLRIGWTPQNRADRGVRWRDAARLLWWHSLLGLLGLVLLAGWAPGGLAWALPWLGPLALAIPFCVLTADPHAGAWLRRHGVAATPEELARQG